MESILIIDDDISLCSMLKEYLALQKMRLTMSHHGLRGLEEARTGRFDLILLDIMLPGSMALMFSAGCGPYRTPASFCLHRAAKSGTASWAWKAAPTTTYPNHSIPANLSPGSGPFSAAGRRPHRTVFPTAPKAVSPLMASISMVRPAAPGIAAICWRSLRRSSPCWKLCWNLPALYATGSILPAAFLNALSIHSTAVSICWSADCGASSTSRTKQATRFARFAAQGMSSRLPTKRRLVHACSPVGLWNPRELRYAEFRPASKVPGS